MTLIQAEGLDNREGWERKQTILLQAIEKYRKTPLETSLNVELARYEYALDKKQEAEDRLSKAGDDVSSIDFYRNPFNSWGMLDKKDGPLVGAFLAHYDQAPNWVGDEALVELSSCQQIDGKFAEMAQTVKRLVARYPDGDRVKVDQDFLVQLRKKFASFPASFPDPENNTMESSCFNKLRRPHMLALMAQIAWAKDGDMSQKLQLTDADGALPIFQLLKTYAFLLSDKEINDYADSGIGFLNRCTAKTWKGPLSIEDTINELKKIKESWKPL